MKKHSDVDVLISFASLRSAFDSTMEAMQYPQVERHTVKYVSRIISIRHCINMRFSQTWIAALLSLILCFQIHTIAIIAEGIPEAQTRKMIKMADEKGVTIIGPATVCSHITPTDRERVPFLDWEHINVQKMIHFNWVNLIPILFCLPGWRHQAGLF